jgi:hypothetical protein
MPHGRSGRHGAAALLALTLCLGLASSRGARAQEEIHLLHGLLALSSDFFSEGDNVFGPGEVVTLSGVVPAFPSCAGMFWPPTSPPHGRGEGLFDFFPVADLYVIPDTGKYLSYLAPLVDASGEPNRVIGTGSGAFVDETVAIVQPAGTLGPGRYDIVMDQCLDGLYDIGMDLTLGAGPGYAFEVVIPGPLPKMDLHPLKFQASLYSKYWAGAKIELPDALDEEPINVPGYCATFAKLIEKAKLEPLDPVGAAAKIAVLQCDNIGKHWDGIAHDPPDPNFMAFADLGDLGYDFQPGAGPLGRAVRALAHVMAEHAAESRALLTTLERFQGAQAAADDEYMVLQLEEAYKLVDLQIGPGGSLLRLYAALEAFDVAVRSDPLGELPEAAALSAILPDLRRGIGGLLHALGPGFDRRKTQSQDIIVPQGFQAWLIVYLGLEPLLATENLPGILQVREASGLPRDREARCRPLHRSQRRRAVVRLGPRRRRCVRRRVRRQRGGGVCRARHAPRRREGDGPDRPRRRPLSARQDRRHRQPDGAGGRPAGGPLPHPVERVRGCPQAGAWRIRRPAGASRGPCRGILPPDRPRKRGPAHASAL